MQNAIRSKALYHTDIARDSKYINMQRAREMAHAMSMLSTHVRASRMKGWNVTRKSQLHG